LLEPTPEGVEVEDLSEVWTRVTRLPFVFAAWFARPGVVDRKIYKILHESRRQGSRAIDQIANEFVWNGQHHAPIAREYLTRCIHFRLGTNELRAMELFYRNAAEHGLIAAAPQIRIALTSWTPCHEAAARNAGAGN
jgi:predicted solute-binding protein